MVLVRSDFDFNLISINSDDEGRSIVMEAETQGSPFQSLVVNIYALNKTQDQCRFFDKLNNNIEDCVAQRSLGSFSGETSMSHSTLTLIVLAADHSKKTVKNIESLCFAFDLVDIWRIRNPERRRFTWRQKTSLFKEVSSQYKMGKIQSTIMCNSVSLLFVYVRKKLFTM